jgi:effector-binding domain-containing protein
MTDEPIIEQRAAQPYVGLRATTTMAGLSAVLDAEWPRIFGWLEKQGIALSAPPVLRYLSVDMEHQLVIDLGIPVTRPVTPGDGLHVDELPAGRWVTLRHVGPYDGLVAANARLQDWAEQQGLRFATDGIAWRGRVEHYVSDPQEVPAAECVTTVDYLLRDEGASSEPRV